MSGRISRSTSATPKSHPKTTTLNSSDFHVSQNSTASSGSQILADTTHDSNHVLPSARVETAEVHSESSLSGSRSLGSPKLESARSHSQPAITLEQDENRNDHQAPGSSPQNIDKVESSDHVHSKNAKLDLNGISSVSLSSDRQQTLSANQNANDNAGNHNNNNNNNNLSSILSTSHSSGKEKGQKSASDSSDASAHILKSVHFMSDIVDKNGNADSPDDIPLQAIPRSNRFDNISDIGEDYDYDYDDQSDDDSDDQSDDDDDDDDDDHSDDEGSVDKLEYNVSLEEIASHEDVNSRDSPLTIEKLSAERDQLRGHRRMGSKERVLTWNIAEMSLEGTSRQNDWDEIDKESGEIIDMMENEGTTDWDGGELYLNLDTKDSKGVEESDELSSSLAVQDVRFSLGVPTDESSELVTETDTSPTADEMVEEGGEDLVPFENIPPLPPSSSFSENSKVIDDLLPKSDSGISGIEDSRISCSLETEGQFTDKEEDRLHEILRQVDSGEELDKSPAERESLNFPSPNQDLNSENKLKEMTPGSSAQKMTETALEQSLVTSNIFYDPCPSEGEITDSAANNNNNRCSVSKWNHVDHLQNVDSSNNKRSSQLCEDVFDSNSTSHNNVLNNISNFKKENVCCTESKLNKYNKPINFVNGSDLIKDIPYILHRRLKIDKELKDETELFAFAETECHINTVDSKSSSSILLEQLNLNNESHTQRKSRGPSPNRRSPSCRTPNDHSPASPRRFELVSYNKLPPKTSYSCIDDTTSPSLEKEILEQIQRRAQKENAEKNQKSEVTAGKEDSEFVDSVIGNAEFVTFRKLPAKDSFSSLDHTTSPEFESDVEKHMTVHKTSDESEMANHKQLAHMTKPSVAQEQMVPMNYSVHHVKGLQDLPEPASVASITRTVVEDEKPVNEPNEASISNEQELDLCLSLSTADDKQVIIDDTVGRSMSKGPKSVGLLLDLGNEETSNNDNDHSHFNDPASVAALILSQDIDTEPNERKITFSTFKPPPSPGSLIGDESEGSPKKHSADTKSSSSLVKQDSIVSPGKPLATITEEESTTDSSRVQSEEMTQKLSGSLRRRNLSCEFAMPRRHSAVDDADDSSLADSQLEDESFDVHDLLEPLEQLHTDEDSEEDFNGSSTSFTRDSETSEACSNPFSGSNRRSLSHPQSNSSSESSSGESDCESRRKLMSIDPLAELENLDMTKLESSEDDDDEVTETKTSNYTCTLAPAASAVPDFIVAASSSPDDTPKNIAAHKLDSSQRSEAGSLSDSEGSIETGRTKMVELNLAISTETPSCGRSLPKDGTYKRVVFCESSSDNTDFQETDSSAVVSSPDSSQLSPLTPDNTLGENSQKEQRTSAVYQNPYAETVLRQELNYSSSSSQ